MHPETRRQSEKDVATEMIPVLIREQSLAAAEGAGVVVIDVGSLVYSAAFERWKRRRVEQSPEDLRTPAETKPVQPSPAPTANTGAIQSPSKPPLEPGLTNIDALPTLRPLFGPIHNRQTNKHAKKSPSSG